MTAPAKSPAIRAALVLDVLTDITCGGRSLEFAARKLSAAGFAQATIEKILAVDLSTMFVAVVRAYDTTTARTPADRTGV